MLGRDEEAEPLTVVGKLERVAEYWIAAQVVTVHACIKKQAKQEGDACQCFGIYGKYAATGQFEDRSVKSDRSLMQDMALVKCERQGNWLAIVVETIKELGVPLGRDGRRIVVQAV